ncbi:uncharacterized protein BX664DRAFT_330778 [Halteromyces radiatus]|uniref:uncharacterized protein n=1 Tax=Halteromyces radiatus TaxID=101107 RepID=UPI002220B247|nr:uncharacterized protein BX664DRAFT_330778 [Halteromyces radiatus]KAI8093864.1 hypothetical protein BX664DRAFT_330778 [Halteromyces radiatus]
MSMDNRPWPLADQLPTPLSISPQAIHSSVLQGKPQVTDLSQDGHQDRKRSRVTSLQLCYSRSWLGKGHVEEYHLTSAEKVRRAIDTVVDNGYEQVDLSHCDLVEIPDGIAELQYITVLRKDTVKTASLQLYLFANQLKTLSPTLFRLQNLSVLSLRCNDLDYLPPEIALLENLVELSLGNNNLTFLPSEIRSLPKLTLLSVCPNPFLQKPKPRSNEPSSPAFPSTVVRPGYVCHTLPSLFELASRQYLSISSNHPSFLPWAIQQRLDSVSSVNRCQYCQRYFLEATTQEMIWMDIINVKMVPLLYRFCSMACSQQLLLE